MPLFLMRLLLVLVGFLMAVPALAAGVDPVLKAKPSSTVSDRLLPGYTDLPFDAVVYRPRSMSRGPAPLLVILHGSNHPVAGYIRSFQDEADKRGMIVLALRAGHETWDLVDSLRDRTRQAMFMRTKVEPRFGRDIGRIDAVLTDFFARTPIDPKRIGLFGFSDGATYALSLGTANPRLFRTIIAFSAGFVTLPPAVIRSQRIFLAHGKSDQTLSFATARGPILGLLRSAGLKVLFRPFEGRHWIDSEARGEALDFFLGGRKPG